MIFTNETYKPDKKFFKIKPVLVDLPVGKGLEDHIGASISIQINASLAYLATRDTTLRDISDYLLYGTGNCG